MWPLGVYNTALDDFDKVKIMSNCVDYFKVICDAMELEDAKDV